MKTLLVRLAISVGTIASALPAQTVPVVNGVVNAGSFLLGPIAPGTIVGIFGTRLASQTLSASTLPLPTALDGTSVTVGGQPVPLFFVSTGQIKALSINKGINMTYSWMA